MEKSKIKPVLFSDIPSPDPLKIHCSELDFRRGYMHGYDSAMDDMRAASLRTEKAWEKVVKFFDGALWKWRFMPGQLKRVEPPKYEP